MNLVLYATDAAVGLARRPSLPGPTLSYVVVPVAYIICTLHSYAPLLPTVRIIPPLFEVYHSENVTQV